MFLFNTVRSTLLTLATCVGIGTVFHVVVTDSVAELERASIAQCANHDWPAQSHDIHMEWCADNGYATN